MNVFVVLLFCGLVVLWFGCIEGRFGFQTNLGLLVGCLVEE